MPRLSILIPCLGGAAEFDGTLVSLLQHRPDDCEILVVHTAPYSDPYALAGEVTFLHAAECGSQVELVNVGLSAARGEIIHVVTCGLEVEEGWTQFALQHFADDEIAAVAPSVLAADRKTTTSIGLRWTLGGVRQVCRDTSRGMLGPVLQAGFWRRDVLVALDGFEASLGDDLADVGLALALRDLQLKTVGEPRSRLIQTSAAAPGSGSLADGQRAERLFWRNVRSAGWGLSLLMHPLAVLGQMAASFPSAATLLVPVGRLLALTEIGARRRYLRRLVRADRLLSSSKAQPATLPLGTAWNTATPARALRKAA